MGRTQRAEESRIFGNFSLWVTLRTNALQCCRLLERSAGQFWDSVTWYLTPTPALHSSMMPAVSLTLLKSFQWCQMTPLKLGKQNFLWLKSLWYFSFHDHGGFSSVIDTAERVSGKQLRGSGPKFQRCHCHQWNSNNAHYFGEYICKTVLACESELGVDWWKNQR
jgi:hypothetical protein